MTAYRTRRVRVACYLHATVTPEQIKGLRSDLRCTARELATTLGLTVAEVQAWESGEQFPTKHWVERMGALRAKGPDAIVRKAKAGAREVSPMAQLANPEIWEVVRKMLAHRKLLAEVTKLAASYKDPAEEIDD